MGIDYYKNHELSNELFRGLFGIEIEEHRVNLKTKSLSRYKHPDNLGDRQTQLYFQTDFSESMEELVTVPHQSIKDSLDYLHSLQSILQSDLNSDEIIWGLSMPPKLTQDDISFLKKTFKRIWYQKYRDYLWGKYGPYQHIISGIHFSFSPDEKIVKNFQQQQQIKSKIEAKNKLLFQIAQQLVGYRWIITYLYGASPVSENENDEIPAKIKQKSPVRSWRASKYGFVNKNDINISYDNLDNFIDNISQNIQKGKLFAPSEFYGPVRLKGPEKIDNIKINGAEYLELRVIDNNPFAPNGVKLSTLNFIHLLIIDGIVSPHVWDKYQLEIAQINNNQVALQHPLSYLTSDLKKQADQLMIRLNKLANFATPKKLKQELIKSLEEVQEAIDDPNKTISGRLVKQLENNSLMKFGIEQGIKIKELYQHESVLEKFPMIPVNLIQSYIKAHQKGLKVKLLDNGNLEIIKKNHEIITLTSDKDLLQPQNNF